MSQAKMTDACVSKDLLQLLHRRISKHGTDGVFNRLADREPSLAAYVLCAGHQVAEMVKSAGAPDHIADWINQEVIARVLVAVQAQRQAHYDLWRDLMGDELPTKGEPNG